LYERSLRPPRGPGAATRRRRMLAPIAWSRWHRPGGGGGDTGTAEVPDHPAPGLGLDIVRPGSI
jgi:hypothetical protein